MTVRGMFDRKRELTKQRREKFDLLFNGASKAVQDEYRRCSAKIKRFLDEKKGKPFEGFEKPLYPPRRGPLTETDVVRLHELLTIDGWNVVQTAPLKWRGKGPRPIGLVFRYRSGKPA